MPIPTDRGYAILQTNTDDGSMNVMVCTGIENAVPVNVFAVHMRRPTVVVDPALRLQQTDAYNYTDQIVEVFAGADGALHVQAPQKVKGLTLI